MYYQTRFKENKSRFELWPIITNYLQKYIWYNKSILELACWYWDFINNISAKEKTAVDIYDWIKEYLKPDIQFKSFDLSKPEWYQNYKGKTFDVVFMSNFLEHLDDDWLNSVMMGINNIIKDDWLIVLIQPNFHYMYKEYFDDYTHKKIFTHVSIKDFVESYWFECIHCEKKFLPWSFKKNKLPLWLSKVGLKTYFKQNFIRLGGQMFLVFKKQNQWKIL